MEQMSLRGKSSERPVVFLEEFAIVLSTPDTIPKLFNPDFLRHNEIASSDWSIKRPVIIESDFSHVVYDNGLSFMTTEENIVISQQGSPLEVTTIRCHEVVGRFLQVWPLDSLETVVFNIEGSIDFPSGGLGPILSPLRNMEIGVYDKDSNPDIQVKLQYKLPSKVVNLLLVERRSEEMDGVAGLGLRVLNQYKVEGETTQEQFGFISSIMGKWKQEIEEFAELSSQLFSKYIPKEH